MTPIRTAAAAILCVTALGVIGGCGSDKEVVVTITRPDTSATSTTGATPTTATTPTVATTDASPELALRLPPPTSIPKLESGDVQKFATAEGLSNALYKPGDPAATTGAQRLRDSGYQGGALRDQKGTAPLTDLVLLRTYVFRLSSPVEATKEVSRGVDEVRATSSPSITELQVPDVPGSRGLSGPVVISGQKAKLVFITFAAGQDVFGLQAIALADAKIYEPQLKELAKSLYIAYGLNP
jgi:hypothetical protein